jgi:hypothetical protein
MKFRDDHLGPDEKRATIRISIADMLGLRVRTRESQRELPKLLYQSLPPDAMALMAGIPRGIPAVSIPRQNGRFPISGLPSPAEDGIIVVYSRKPNGRYEALEVVRHGKSYALDEFCATADRWLDQVHGGLKTVAGRYACFAPTRDQWEVVQRDGGFTVIDPSAMPFDVTQELVQSRNQSDSSGLIARIPVKTGRRSPDTTYLPVFSRVELTPDPNPDPAGPWMSYVEFQRLRAIGSRPPDTVIPNFRSWMHALTVESGFTSWNFQHGMFFGDHSEWWGDKNRRRTLHEGIDFAEGFKPDAARGGIPDGTPVRALADGNIVAVFDDFLNKTVAVRHPKITNEAGDLFFTFYSHIQPANRGLHSVSQGETLGSIVKSKNAAAPPHLHLTGAWVPESMHPGEITMDRIHPAFVPITLINFNSLLVGSRH